MSNKFFGKIGGFVKNTVYEVKTYWKKPKPGEYVSYKEFASYILGTSGCNGLGSILGYLGFTAGCVLIGKIYEIPMAYFAILGIIGIPMTYLASPINMLVQDNLGNFDKKRMRILNSILIPLFIIGIACYFVPQQYTEFILPSLPQVIGTIIATSIFNIYYRMFVFKKLSKKFGKFRPFIIAGILPFMVSFALIIYLPYQSMETHTRFWVLHLVFCMYNIFLGFSQQVGALGNVISPSSEERSKIMSIGGFAFSLIPSIVGIFLPIFVGMTGGFENINTYRIVFPVFVVILSVLGLFLVFGVKEKVLLSKVHTAKINFSDGAKQVLSNKNYLALNFSNFFGCLSQGAVALNFVLFIYIARNSALFGIYSGIIGTACIPGLLMAPFLIKKFGKKRLVLISRIFVIAASILTYFAMLLESIALFIIINYIQQIVVMPAGISSQAMNADVWDEMQLKSGQRLDGMTGIFGLMQTPFYALAGLMMPAIYLTMGFSSDWNILYVGDFRMPIVTFTVIIGVVVAILGTIPFFFYDLTEKKHRDIIEQLKAIAAENGGFEDQELAESSLAATNARNGSLDDNGEVLADDMTSVDGETVLATDESIENDNVADSNDITSEQAIDVNAVSDDDIKVIEADIIIESEDNKLI